MVRPSPVSVAARWLMLLALGLGFLGTPAAAQQVLRDAETELFFRDLARPLAQAAGLRPENLEIVLLQSNEINAFVVGGQRVYFYSGLLEAAESVNEVEGVVAHELGHITGGHIIRSQEAFGTATSITLVSLLLGVAAIAAGAGEAGMGLLGLGQQAALGQFLAYNRTQESAADQAGAAYLAKAGISGRGSLAFFKKLQNQEFRLAIPQDDSYGRTHPLTGDRLAALETSYKADPAWNRAPDPRLEARFQRIRAKLFGFAQDPKRTLVRYPETDRSVPARYARAYGWHKSAYPEKAQAEVDALLAAAPADPFFLELKGQVSLESGKPAEALASLRRAVALAPDQPLIAALLGHALIATEDPKNFAEAKTVLRSAVARDPSNPFAWYQLGIVYDREGDTARASLATAERYALEGRPQLALASAEAALHGIPAGTPDHLRAQDLAMVAKAAAEKQKKDR